MKADIYEKLRSFEHLDYNILTDTLSGYSSPRDQIWRLVKRGELIQIKKGLYLLSDSFRKQPFSREILANLIYGPSYLSMHYALGYYGMIPERVTGITSMTTQRDKEFDTPVGRFSYRYIGFQKYVVGITFRKSGREQFLIATPEKALADLVAHEGRFENQQELDEYLTENMRIEPDTLAKLKLETMKEIARAYRSKSINLLVQCLEAMK